MRPILFYLPGGVPVWSYGIMLGLSCVAGAHLAVYLAERSEIEAKKAWWFALIVIVCGILGGRFHELIVTGKFNLSEITKLQHSGRTAYGGFLAAILSAIVAARLLKVSFWRFADAAAPTMALGLGLTRIGCFLYGCDYGLISEDWGVRFPQGSPAWNDQHYHLKGPDGQPLIPLSATESLPVLPSQIISSLAGFALFGVLMKIWYRRPRKEGTVLLSFLFGYGLVRAGLEQLRSDLGRGEMLGLTTSTAIGLGSAAVAAAFLFVPALTALRGDAGEVVEPPPEEEEGGQEGQRTKGKQP